MPKTLSINTSTGCFISESEITSGSRSYVITFKTLDNISTISGVLCGDVIGNTPGLALFIENGVITVYGTELIIGPTLSPNTLYQAVATYDKYLSEIKLYLNNVLVATGTYTIPEGTNTFGLGNLPIEGTPNLDVDIYNSFVSNKTLSQQDITVLWNNGVPDKYVLSSDTIIPLNPNNYISDFTSSVDSWNALGSFGGSIQYTGGNVIVTFAEGATPEEVKRMQLYRGKAATTQEKCQIFCRIVTSPIESVGRFAVLPWAGYGASLLTSRDIGNNQVEWSGLFNPTPTPGNIMYIEIDGLGGSSFTLYSIEFISVGYISEYQAETYNGGNWLDSTHNNKDLLVVGSPTINKDLSPITVNKTESILCNSGYFELSDNFIGLEESITFSIVFKTEELLTSGGLLFSQSNSNSSLRIEVSTTNILKAYLGDQELLFNQPLVENTIYNVIVSYNNQTNTLSGYINNQFIASINTTYINNPNGFYLCGINNSAYFPYKFISCRVFNKVIDTNTINALWNNGNPQYYSLGNSYIQLGCIAEYLAYYYDGGLILDTSRRGNSLTQIGTPTINQVSYQQKPIPWDDLFIDYIYVNYIKLDGNQYIWIESDPNKTNSQRSKDITFTTQNNIGQAVLTCTQDRDSIGSMIINSTFLIS